MKKRSGNKRGICCTVIAAGMAVIAVCGRSAVVSAENLCVEEEYLCGDGRPDSTLAKPGDRSVEAVCDPGVYSHGNDPVPAAADSQTGQKTASVMGSVPYFRDDAGKNIQTLNGYLYGYWENRLCRYDLETLEETVLYEAASSQNGDFCIWGDNVYFMVVPHVSAVGKLHGYLYRVPCDGGEEAVCLASVVMPGQESGGQYYQNYILDTYEDILYLIQQNGGRENLYFRLNQDGSIARARESETLYGRLPEGDFTGWNYSNKGLMSLPYCMRNYGCVFMKNEDGDPVRIDLDSQQTEVMEVLTDYVIRDITNDAVLVSTGNVWYRIPLDDIGQVQEIGESPSRDASYAAWDAEGIYFTMESGGYGRVYFMDWEGEKTTLQYGFLRKPYSPVGYFGQDYYYYVAEKRGSDIIRRLELSDGNDGEAEDVAVYKGNAYGEIVSRESFDYGWTDTYTGANVDYNIIKVFFKEDRGALGKINDFLESLYTQDIDSLEEYKEIVKENSEEDWGEWEADYVEYSDVYNVSYMDKDYVCIDASWYQCWKGAAHGMHGSVCYVFDRNSGNRVSVTDVVNNSPEEICEIIAPYVEAVADWGIAYEGWEAAILEEGRFFLTGEGIGIHFDTYEIACYAAGDQDIIVPYSMFELAER